MAKGKYISNIITILTVAIFVIYGYYNQQLFDGLGSLSIVTISLIVIGRLTIFLSNGLFTKWTAEAFTRKLTTGEGVYVGILSAIGNFFGPLLGGASIRAVYLKKYYQISLSHFTSMLMGYYLILFLINCAAALFAVIVLPKTDQSQSLIIFFGIWLLVLIGLTTVKLPKRERLKKVERNRIGKKLVETVYKIEQGWLVLIRNKQILGKMLSLAVMSFLALFFISYIEFKAINVDVALPSLALYTAVVAISLLVSVTPGAIGVREALLLIVSSTMGISNEEILQVAVIDRAVMFALLFVLFVITRSQRLKKIMTKHEIAV